LKQYLYPMLNLGKIDGNKIPFALLYPCRYGGWMGRICSSNSSNFH
jgi:hypothetical protein